jgi:N-acylneuraminate cytidylyltransferase
LNKLNYVAFIPARGGSKGVPGKNIKLINGLPLIVWSIQCALRNKKISEVYVSTDSEEIKEIALSAGAKVPFLRPQNISGDEATTESAVEHFINWSDDNKVNFSHLILMQATSPFRYDESLQGAIEQYENVSADSLLTVCKTDKFFWKNIHSSNPVASYDVSNRPRRQDIKEEDQIYFENGSFYITKRELYKALNNRLGGKVSSYEMSHEESFQIDDDMDFDIVELLMKKFNVQ